MRHVGDLEAQPCGSRLPSVGTRELDHRRGEVDTPDLRFRELVRNDDRELAGPAPDVQHTADVAEIRCDVGDE